MTIDPRPLTPERREHLETIARRWDHSDDIRERSWSEAVTDLLAALAYVEDERDGWKARAEKAEPEAFKVPGPISAIQDMRGVTRAVVGPLQHIIDRADDILRWAAIPDPRATEAGE